MRSYLAMSRMGGAGFCLALLSCFFPAAAQEYCYIRYDIEDGLAGSNVRLITQDKDGFLWIATETGLSMFDGTRFRNFSAADGLLAHEPIAVLVDSRNRVWIKPFDSKRYYYQNGKIQNPQNNALLRKISVKDLSSSIGEDAHGNIIFEDTGQCWVITPNDSMYTVSGETLRREPGKRFNIVRAIGCFRASNMILPPRLRAFVNDSIRSQYCPVFRWPADTGYVIPYDYRIHRFSRDGTLLGQFNVPEPRDRVLMLPLNDSILCMGNFNNDGARFFDMARNKQVSTHLRSEMVIAAFTDREGNIWFGTRKSGMFKLPAAPCRKYHLGPRKTSYMVVDLQKVGDRIYAGADDERYYSLPAVRSINPIEEEDQFVPKPVERSRSLLKKFAPRALINTNSFDFFRILDYIPPDTLFGVLKTLCLSGDTLLVATHVMAALYRFPELKRLKTLYADRTTCAYRQDSTYYIGTIKGLYTVGEKGEAAFLGGRDSVLRNRISFLTHGRDGMLWVALYEQGVAGYRNNKVVVHLTKQQGLSSNTCRCLYVTDSALWVGTDKGLNKVDITRTPYRVTAVINSNDGLNSDIINCILVDGNIVYVGTPLGVNCFDESKIPKHAMCELRMTGIRISGREYDPVKDRIELLHKDNNIRFDFSGISFLSSGGMKYRYRLLGLSDEWQLTTENVLNYPTLPSGSYTLQLTAINKFNDRSRMLEWHFKVKPTIWEEPAVRLLLLLVIIGFTWLITYLYVRSIRRKEQEKHRTEQKISDLEQMALRAQMNPHFIFNCLNSVQHYIIRRDSRSANFYLSQFARLVRATLENSSRMYIPLSEEIQYLTHYIELEKLQFADSFDYVIHVDPEIDADLIPVPNMVIQPYVENVFKHALIAVNGKGLLELSFRLYRPDVLECTITDNGPGMKATIGHRSRTYEPKGMSITQKRVAVLNQISGKKVTVTVKDRQEEGTGATGTRIIIRFPL